MSGKKRRKFYLVATEKLFYPTIIHTYRNKELYKRTTKFTIE